MVKSLIDNFWRRFLHRPNTVANNIKVWSEWDWSRLGEEWSNNPEWKQSLVDDVLLRYLGGRESVLEIGPGGGRWTEYLAKTAKQLAVVDITPVCIDICRERFMEYSHISYFVNNGTDLTLLGNLHFDGIWSWDVFVHVAAEDVRRYVKQFSTLINPGGVAVIHHSKQGVSRTGWRSDMTSDKMIEFSTEAGLVVEQQFESWGDGKFRIWPGLPLEQSPDTISVLRKP
ncbi:class I SAM-dependent methyltransferase [Geotalea sp. SG265]|uniref:class I SAM-dependent methyltransferase n=1 Tax=Geotalea sp. SG265 TaxID=2922867 RepID=UPI001FAEED4A|nr:class I SAM-dependent methyltransferase [Geotalea sp. SG265]